MRKPKPIGPLSRLTPEQKQILRQLYAEFTYEQIQARIALPPPDGFGIDASVWQLRRYFYRLGFDQSPQAPPEIEPQTVSEIIDQAALGRACFTPAAIHLLEKRAFELALAGAEPKEILTLLGIVLKSRDSTVRERMAEVQKGKLALKQKMTRKNSPDSGSAKQQPNQSLI
jgi:hypothetical protein